MRAWTYEDGVMWVMDLDNDYVIRPISPKIAATFGEVQAENAQALALAMELSDSEIVLQRLTNGRRCFAAQVEGQFAAYGWVSQTSEYIGEHERTFQLAAREAYIWDCATRLPYRRQHLYSALLGQIVVQLRSEQVRRIWIGVSVSNRPSQRAFANVGFRPALRLVYIRLFNMRGAWMLRHAGASAELALAAHQALTAAHERWWGNIWIGWTHARPTT